MLTSDERLTHRATDGDEAAFEAIFRRYQESLYRYCLAIVGNPEDAQDALQNTMVKVLRALPGEERRIELKPWLYRIAHNESIELIRRRRPSEELDQELLAGGAGLAEEASQRQRLRGLLDDIEQLPERQRGTLVMRELGGLEFEEIGAALGTSAATARQTLYEARLGLREMDAGREMSCGEVTRAISDADGRVLRRRDLRAHLRSCQDCRAFREEIEGRHRDFAALSPLPAAAVAGLLHSLLAGGGGSSAAAGGSGLATAVGGGAAKTLGASAALKGLATVAVVAAIGVTAADRGGLVHLGLPGDGGSDQAGKTAPPTTESAASSQPGEAAPGSRSPGSGDSLEPAASTSGASGVGGAAVAAKASAGEPASAPASTPAGSAVGDTPAADPKLPSASSHGQETAASHKSSNSGSHSSHPAHPVKPTRTAHPSHPPHPAHPKHPANPAAPPSKAATKEAPAAPPKDVIPAAEKPATGPEAAAVAGEEGKKR